MKFQIVTNNPRVRQVYEGRFPVYWIEGSLKEVIAELRDMAQSGYEILSHPLSGSVKPNETLYKSVLVSEKPHNNMEGDSVMLMEQAYETVQKFRNLCNHWNKQVLEDFQTVDFALISSALQSAVNDHTC